MSFNLQALLASPLPIAGVDEAGRGPLAGSVFAAAVILDPARPISGLNDSKKLTAKRREELRVEIQEKSLAWCIAHGSVEEIDRLNILQATLLAMSRAVAGLSVQAQHVLVDGNQVPQVPCPVDAIIGGDAQVPAISAASILAKTARDQEMVDMEDTFPGYGFAKHKGYGTKVHMQALQSLGPTPIHRRSFAPVRKLLPA